MRIDLRRVECMIKGEMVVEVGEQRTQERMRRGRMVGMTLEVEGLEG
jgi:hypothetical protein